MTTLQELWAFRRRQARERRERLTEPAHRIKRVPTPDLAQKPELSPAPTRSTGSAISVRVVVMAHERPRHLLRLLEDVEASATGYDVSLVVYDDASTTDPTAAREVVERNGWTFVRAKRRHGKRGFWKWVSRAYAEQRSRTEDVFVLLPDDVRLCERFFDRALDLWERIDDPHKAALNVLRDDSRADSPCWTRQDPRDAGHVVDVGWVDGAVVCGRTYFESLAWRVDPVDPSRFRDPLASSGVGQQLSLRLKAKGMRMYAVRHSLLVHVVGPSRMNPEERLRNPLRTKDFVDGEAACRRLERPSSVVASLASVPRRISMLARAVASLVDQCDRVNVYLNGYRSVPGFLNHPRVTVARSQDHGDLGDAGKFWWSDKVSDTYHLTADDDIVYPPDYAARLVSRIERYGRRAVVGAHGVVLPEEIDDAYYGARKVYPCVGSLSRDLAVHLLGTGALAYHTSTIVVRPEDFRRRNMADVWFALLAKVQKIPMICVARKHGWIRSIPDPHIAQSIAGRFREHNGVQADILRRHNPWPPPLTVPTVRRGARPPRRNNAKGFMRRANPNSGREFGATVVRGGGSGVRRTSSAPSGNFSRLKR